MDYTIVQDAFGLFRLPTALEERHGLKGAFDLIAARRSNAWASGKHGLPFAAHRDEFNKLRLVANGREVRANLL